MKLIIHAPNVHQGGGKALLLSLLQSLGNDLECVLLHDARLDIPRLVANVSAISYAPSFAGRLTAEWRLRSLARKNDIVLCMGNLPPLFALASQTCLFLQNRYLCEPASLSSFGVATRLRIVAERFWIRRFLPNVSRVIVQTASMRESVHRNLAVDAVVVPFAEVPVVALKSKTPSQPVAKRFLYPASAEPHKNHVRLIEAWRLLQVDGVEAELHLTVSLRASLARDIENLREREDLSIINHGEVDPLRLGELYAVVDAMIFPSTMESFGLPLVEAQALGLPIIAAERDYVRDVSEPEQTFDPCSPVSIARAVKRFLGNAEPPHAILNPREFLAAIEAL